MSGLFAYQWAAGHYLSYYYSFVLKMLKAKDHGITRPCASRCSQITQHVIAN